MQKHNAFETVWRFLPCHFWKKSWVQILTYLHFSHSSFPHSCPQKAVSAGTKHTVLCVLIHYAWDATTISLESLLSPWSASFHSFISPFPTRVSYFLTPSLMEKKQMKTPFLAGSPFVFLPWAEGELVDLAPGLITLECLLLFSSISSTPSHIVFPTVVIVVIQRCAASLESTLWSIDIIGLEYISACINRCFVDKHNVESQSLCI